MPAMLVVPVSLNQISGARASTRSDQRAFGSAVVHPVIAAISPLSIYT
jgi:hypothetical protein